MGGTIDNGKLIEFTDKRWSALICIASLRKKLKSDKHFEATKKILTNKEGCKGYRYHSLCHKNYTAVKRPKSSPKKSKKPCVSTRGQNVLPKSDKGGC